MSRRSLADGTPEEMASLRDSNETGGRVSALSDNASRSSDSDDDVITIASRNNLGGSGYISSISKPRDLRQHFPARPSPRSPAATRACYAMLLILPMVAILAALALVVANVPPPAAEDLEVPSPETGSPTPGSQRAALESAFLASVSAQSIRDHVGNLSSLPHSAGDMRTVRYVRAKLLKYGFDKVEVVEHRVLSTAALGATLTATGIASQFARNGIFTAALEEPDEASLSSRPEKADQASSRNVAAGVRRPFNGFSASGDIRNACVVYANYGSRKDFENVNVSGCVAIVRYGRLFRGNKARLAEEHGALGVLIYSDPQDDGCRRGAVYPDGPWRPSFSAQRGSVWVGNGDPLSPGWPSTPEAPRYEQALAFDADLMRGSQLPRIPIMPLAWRDALPIMQGLCAGGSASLPDESWSGGLPASYDASNEDCSASALMNYCVGGADSPVRVNFTLEMNNTSVRIHNVIGVIRGHTDRAVILGAHRDAWTYGAVDPSSGQGALLGIAEALAKLRADNPEWRPHRTLIFASWDAEEMGLIGSYEWGEQFSAFVRAKAVAYVNIDIAVSGKTGFKADGTPNFKTLMESCARQVKLPQLNDEPSSTPTTPADMWASWQRYSAAAGEQNGAVTFPPLGAGSDFVVFLQRLGVSSITGRYADNHPYPVYHSNYDSFNWILKFADPNFARHAAVAKTLGLAVLRLADAPRLPYDWVAYATALESYATKVLSSTSVNGAKLVAAIAHLKTQAKLVAKERPEEATVALADLNDRMMLAERAFLRDVGLPKRPFIQHSAWAPSSIDSYNGTAFSSIVDAISEGNNAVAQFEADLIAVNIKAAAQVLGGW